MYRKIVFMMMGMYCLLLASKCSALEYRPVFNITASSNFSGDSFSLHPGVGGYEFDRIRLWNGVGTLLFSDDFSDPGLDGWTILNGNWSCSGGIAILDDDTTYGSLLANNVVMPENYIFEYDIKVTRNNPVFSYVNHLRATFHTDTVGNYEYSPCLRTNGMNNWAYSETDGQFLTSSFTLTYGDHVWNRIRVEKDGTNIQMFVAEYVPEPGSMALLVLGGMAALRRRKSH